MKYTKEVASAKVAELQVKAGINTQPGVHAKSQLVLSKSQSEVNKNLLSLQFWLQSPRILDSNFMGRSILDLNSQIFEINSQFPNLFIPDAIREQLCERYGLKGDGFWNTMRILQRFDSDDFKYPETDYLHHFRTLFLNFVTDCVDGDFIKREAGYNSGQLKKLSTSECYDRWISFVSDNRSDLDLLFTKMCYMKAIYFFHERSTADNIFWVKNLCGLDPGITSALRKWFDRNFLFQGEERIQITVFPMEKDARKNLEMMKQINQFYDTGVVRNPEVGSLFVLSVQGAVSLIGTFNGEITRFNSPNWVVQDWPCDDFIYGEGTPKVLIQYGINKFTPCVDVLREDFIKHFKDKEGKAIRSAQVAQFPKSGFVSKGWLSKHLTSKDLESLTFE